MKKNRTLILLALLLGVLSVYFLFRNSDNTVRKELRDFAIGDTAAITGIFLADRNGHTVHLQRKSPTEWVLNDSLSPRPDNLHYLINAISRLSIKSHIPKTGYNNVIKNLASGGIKCEIYLHGEKDPSKIYYVGGETQDALGTYMMLENSTLPFIMEVPGFNGYLTPRYSPNVENWKVPAVFMYNPDSVRSVSVTYPAFPERSFVLEHRGTVNRIINPVSGKQLQRIDSVAVDNYLGLFRAMYYEGPENSMLPATRDSLRLTEPLVEMIVRDAGERMNEVIIYPMPLHEGSLTLEDSLGRPLRYDVDRMYAFLKTKQQWVIIQHYTFDHLFRSWTDFDLDQKKRRLQVQ